MKKTKSGYTLAEVLIVMIVIGVLAAILMPMFGNLRPNQEQVMLKKAYYEAGRIVTELINDDELYAETDKDETSGFANTAQIKYKGKYYGTVANKKFCELFVDKINVKGAASCQSYTLTSAMVKGQPATSKTFATADGMVWILPISTFGGGSGTYQSMYVDVNGDKGPNCFSGFSSLAASVTCAKSQGPDRFEIQVNNLGKLKVPDRVSEIYLETNKTTKTYKDLIKGKLSY